MSWSPPLPSCGEQRQQQLMRLQETDPSKFDEYVQMVADVAELAKDRPDVYDALIQETAAGADITAARLSLCAALTAQTEYNERSCRLLVLIIFLQL